MFAIKTISSLLSLFSGRREGKLFRRSWEAANTNRLNNDWQSSAISYNSDLRTGKQTIDERVEYLYKNNPYASAYRVKTRTGIIGWEGFRLQAKSKFLGTDDYDDLANQIIEDGFAKWSRKEFCTMSKRLSFVRVQWLVLTYLKKRGEFLVRVVTGKDGLKSKDNPFSFSLEILDPYDIDSAYKDELPGGNVVYMGVEMNQWKEIVAVHMRKRTLMNEISSIGVPLYGKRERIPIEQLIYDFDIDDIKQVRGVSPLASVLLSINDVDRWNKNSLVNASAAAAKMGFLKRVRADAENYVGSSLNNQANGNGQVEDTDADGGKYMDFSPGTIEELPYGYDYVGYDPKFPTDQHTPFLKSLLRTITSALNLSYNSFHGDLEGVNYSSMRSGLQDERDQFKVDQTLIRESFLIPVYTKWLKWALYSQALTANNGTVILKPANYEKYLEHTWQARRWPWIDPQSDTAAAQLAEEMGYATKSGIVADRGGDFEEICKVKAQEQRIMAKYGVEFGVPGKSAPPVDTSANTDPNANNSTQSIKIIQIPRAQND